MASWSQAKQMQPSQKWSLSREAAKFKPGESTSSWGRETEWTEQEGRRGGGRDLRARRGKQTEGQGQEENQSNRETEQGGHRQEKLKKYGRKAWLEKRAWGEQQEPKGRGEKTMLHLVWAASAWGRSRAKKSFPMRGWTIPPYHAYSKKLGLNLTRLHYQLHE